MVEEDVVTDRSISETRAKDGNLVLVAPVPHTVLVIDLLSEAINVKI